MYTEILESLEEDELEQREDHFSNGSFEYRQRAGQVDEILKRMVAELNK